MKTIQDWLLQNSGGQEKDQRLFLTEEEVRSSPHFKDSTQEEIENVINTLHTLALLTYECFCDECHKNESISQAA